MKLNDNTVILDIETVPCDMEQWAIDYIDHKISNKRGDNKDPIKYASLTAEFAKLACIVYRHNGHTFKLYNKSEQELLSAFWGALATIPNYIESPLTVVTFNGIGFDIPTLIKRSIINDIATHGIKIPTKKYSTKGHFDVMGVLSGYDISKVHSLDICCKMYNIPFDNTDGSDIYALYQQGLIEEITDHCEKDVIATEQLYNKIKNYY